MHSIIDEIELVDEEIIRIKVRRAIRDKNISVNELSYVIGVSRATLYRWLNSEKSLTYETIVKMLEEIR